MRRLGKARSALLCALVELEVRNKHWRGPGESPRGARAEGFAKISDAFREGRLSYSKVRAMTRVGTPENEDYLMMIAKHGTAAHVDRLVRLYRQVKRTEALAQENRRHEFRELSLYQLDHDCFVIRGRLTPEQGALVKKALEAAMDEDFNEQENAPAGTLLHCVPPMPHRASTSRPKAR